MFTGTRNGLLVLAAAVMLVATPVARAESPDVSNDIPGTPLPSSQPVNGRVADGADNDDVYSTNIAAGRWFWVQLRGDSGTDFDLALFGPTVKKVAEGPALVYSERKDTSFEYVRYKALVDTVVYTDVFAYKGAGDYSLTYGTPSTEIVVSAAAATTCAWDASTPITGRATRKDNSNPVGGERLYLFAKRYGATQYEYVKSTVTADDGTYSFSANPSRRTEYRVRHLGSKDYITPKNAPTLVITPRAYLRSPYTPSTVTHGVYWTASGNLRPRHKAGVRDVYVRIYKHDEATDKYVYQKTFRATNYDLDSETTKYKARVYFPSAGKWSIRAYIQGDTTHVATYSAYRYRDVK
ncbi:MAG TPA: hypothetical protein VLA05_07010 [Coriobacteriia bacterium]|nr:hypothetical protein [Coriobacteriia bacterium]